MQYALVMADPQSNVLVDLLEKVSNGGKSRNSFRHKRTVMDSFDEESSFGNKLVTGKLAQSFKLGNRERCFGDTVNLMFKLKKKQCWNK